MAYSYKTSITFGMVYIPITLTTVVKNNDISFNMLDKKTLSRVKYKKTCYECGDRELAQSDIVRGFQYQKGKYVIMDDSDFEAVKTKKDRTIAIEQFVDLAEIDPIYFDRSYYVIPQKSAEKAYALLCHTMLAHNKVGIAKTVLGTKEVVVALRVRDRQLLLNTMHFDEDVERSPAIADIENLSTKEVEIASTIIQSMSMPFVPSQYRDEYKQKLMNAIQAKIDGQQVVAVQTAQTPVLLDLMQALEASLAQISAKTQRPQSKRKPAIKKAAKRGA